MITALFLVWVPPAQAQDSRAKELYENGVDLYNDGRYEDAIAAWTGAYDLAEKPLLLYNLSNAYERAGQVENALDALTRYRAFAVKEEREVLDRRIRNLEGRVDVERKEDTATANELATQKAALEAERKRAEELQAREDARGSFPLLPVVTTVAGVGLLTTGVVTGLGANKKRKTLKDPAVCGESGICTSVAEPLVGPQKSSALVSDLTLGAGLVVTGFGAYLFVKHLGKNDTTAVYAAPSPDGATMGVRGAF